jgi:hypothetical protein
LVSTEAGSALAEFGVLAVAGVAECSDGRHEFGQHVRWRTARSRSLGRLLHGGRSLL